MRHLAAALAAVVMFGTLATHAAAGEYFYDGAVGPLKAGQPVRAGLARDIPSRTYFFYVRARGVVILRATVESATAEISGYRAGYEWPVAGGIDGSWSETVTLDPGFYRFRLDINSGAPHGVCTLLADGPTVTQSRPPSVWPSWGSWHPGAGTNTFSLAPVVPPLFRVTPDTVAASQRFRFFVTTACDVTLGHGDGYEGYRDWGVHGRIYDHAFNPVGPPLDHDSPVVTTRLNPGVYFLKWSSYDGGPMGLYSFGVEGTYVTARPFAAMTRPYAPQSVRRDSAFKSYGKLSPKHAAGARSVLVKAYRYESGHYVYKKAYTATVKEYTATTSKYLASVALPSAGRWRIRAYHRDAGHLKSYSSYRYVTVR